MEKTIILDEDHDIDYNPTDQEIEEYAIFLGIDPSADKDLLWIAKEGLKAPLPPDWKPCQTEDDQIYYFNFKTGESIWDHPCDEHYRSVFQREKEKKLAMKSSPGAGNVLKEDGLNMSKAASSHLNPSKLESRNLSAKANPLPPALAPLKVPSATTIPLPAGPQAVLNPIKAKPGLLDSKPLHMTSLNATQPLSSIPPKLNPPFVAGINKGMHPDRALSPVMKLKPFEGTLGTTLAKENTRNQPPLSQNATQHLLTKLKKDDDFDSESSSKEEVLVLNDIEKKEAASKNNVVPTSITPSISIDISDELDEEEEDEEIESKQGESKFAKIDLGPSTVNASDKPKPVTALQYEENTVSEALSEEEETNNSVEGNKLKRYSIPGQAQLGNLGFLKDLTEERNRQESPSLESEAKQSLEEQGKNVAIQSPYLKRKTDLPVMEAAKSAKKDDTGIAKQEESIKATLSLSQHEEGRVSQTNVVHTIPNVAGTQQGRNINTIGNLEDGDESVETESSGSPLSSPIQSLPQGNRVNLDVDKPKAENVQTISREVEETATASSIQLGQDNSKKPLIEKNISLSSEVHSSQTHSTAEAANINAVKNVLDSQLQNKTVVNLVDHKPALSENHKVELIPATNAEDFLWKEKCLDLEKKLKEAETKLCTEIMMNRRLSEMEEGLKATEDELKKRREEGLRELDFLKRQLAEDEKDIRLSNQIRIQQLQKELETEVRQMQEQHQVKLKEEGLQWKDRIDEAERKYVLQLNNLELEYTNKISEGKRKLDKEEANWQSRLQQELSSTHSKTYQLMTMENSLKIEKLKEGYESETKSLKESHELQLKGLQREFEKEMALLKDQFSKEKQSCQAQHEEQLQQLGKEFESSKMQTTQAIADLREKHIKEYEQLCQDHATQIEQTKRQFEFEMQKIKHDQDERRKNIDNEEGLLKLHEEKLHQRKLEEISSSVNQRLGIGNSDIRNIPKEAEEEELKNESELLSLESYDPHYPKDKAVLKNVNGNKEPQEVAGQKKDTLSTALTTDTNSTQENPPSKKQIINPSKLSSTQKKGKAILSKRKKESFIIPKDYSHLFNKHNTSTFESRKRDAWLGESESGELDDSDWNTADTSLITEPKSTLPSKQLGHILKQKIKEEKYQLEKAKSFLREHIERSQLNEKKEDISSEEETVPLEGKDLPDWSMENPTHQSRSWVKSLEQRLLMAETKLHQIEKHKQEQESELLNRPKSPSTPLSPSRKLEGPDLHRELRFMLSQIHDLKESLVPTTSSFPPFKFKSFDPPPASKLDSLKSHHAQFDSLARPLKSSASLYPKPKAIFSIPPNVSKEKTHWEKENNRTREFIKAHQSILKSYTSTFSH